MKKTLFLGLLMASGVVRTDTIPVRFVNVDGLSRNFSIKFAEDRFISTRAGIYNLKTGDVPGGAYDFENKASVTSFCIDLRQDVPDSTQTYNIDLLKDAPVTSKSGDKMGPIKADAVMKFWYQFGDSVVSQTQKSAFQLAMWELVWENWTTVSQLNVNNYVQVDDHKGFRVKRGNRDARNQANDWLAALDLDDANTVGLLALTNSKDKNHYQDYVVRNDGEWRGGEAPGPPMLVLLLTLAGTLGFSRFRRRR